MKTATIFLMGLFLFVGGGLSYGKAPWGALRGFDLSAEGKPAEPGKMGERYLLPQVLRGEPVRVFLTAHSVSDAAYEKYQHLVAENYNKWFLETATEIAQAKREQEFADILPVLQKGIPVVFVENPKQADIQIKVVPWKLVRLRCGSMAAGCYVRKEAEIPEIFLPKDDLLLKVFSLGKDSASKIGLHEIGHSLGLSDQYNRAKDASSHPRYSSAEIRKGVMRDARAISCDDADGIINLIDLVRGNARGGNTGWKSLCPRSKEYYIRSQSALRGPYDIKLEETNNLLLTTYLPNGDIYQKLYALAEDSSFSPLQPVQEKVLQQDAFGRKVLTQGINGEKIYYSYTYESYTRLAVKNGRAVWVERRWPVWKNREKITKLFFFFQKDSSLIFLGGDIPKRGKGKMAFYAEQDLQGKELFSLELSLDAESGKNPARIKTGKNVFVPAKVVAAPNLANTLDQQVKQKMQAAKREKIRKQLMEWYNSRLVQK